LKLDDPSEASGVNDRLQLARAEAVLRRRINDQWLARGVTMWDPDATYVDADVELAAEVSLLPGTILKGHSVIARGARIGPNALLTDVEIGENAFVGTVEASRVRVGADARVASFVVLGPGADVATGEFVTPLAPRPH
jgi:bifunctional UDP-N-acetylglucosamine pyrophosphorylase/glucosamine-1-phosphate N-acetyltransferase